MFGNLVIGQSFRKILIWAKISVNPDFCQHVGKLSRFWSKFLNISTLVEILDNLDFGRNYREIFILVKIFDKSRFSSKVLKMLILVEIFGEYQFWSKFLKKYRWSKFLEISILGKKFQTILTLPKFSIISLFFLQIFKENYLDFFLIFENIDFSLNFWKSWYWSKFSKNLDLSQIWKLSRFLSQLLMISNFV